MRARERRRRPVTLWVAVVLGLSLGGWALFDGLHRLVTGDFVRIEGQLGPWAPLVESVGIDPMSMGIPFTVLGVAWLAASVALVRLHRAGWIAAVVLSVVTLLYCCISTLFALVTLVLLLLPATRAAFGMSGARAR